MYIVTVERYNGESKEMVGRMYLWSDGSGDVIRANYNVAVRRRGAEKITPHDGLHGPGTVKTGKALNIPVELKNIWQLVSKAIRGCYPTEV